MYSHATYWDGVRRKMSEVQALQEAVEWIWSIHKKNFPLAMDEDERLTQIWWNQ